MTRKELLKLAKQAELNLRTEKDVQAAINFALLAIDAERAIYIKQLLNAINHPVGFKVWQGLKEGEIEVLKHQCLEQMGSTELGFLNEELFAKAIEAKLKERNE